MRRRAHTARLQVLGDRSLKLKYLNPNTLFLASGTPPDSPAAGTKAARITAHLIDTVTGRVLWSQTHEVQPVGRSVPTSPSHSSEEEAW